MGFLFHLFMFSKNFNPIFCRHLKKLDRVDGAWFFSRVCESEKQYHEQTNEKIRKFYKNVDNVQSILLKQEIKS